MKKIEVKEYATCEHLVIVYELDEKYVDDEDVDFDDICVWNKVDLYDPMLRHGSGVNVGYRGEGPDTLALIIAETFRDYNSSEAYIKARNNIEEYLSKIKNDNNNSINNFCILEKDIEHLL